MSTSRELFLDAVVGAGFPSYDGVEEEFADKAVKRGLARWTGDQYNTDWEWDRAALAEASDEELQALYTKIKELQHAGK